MDYSTLQSSLLARLSMDTNDPASISAPALVNEAIHHVETLSPMGWPWARRTIDVTATPSENTIAFSAITDNDSHPAIKILEVKVATENIYLPLLFLSMDEMDDLWRGNSTSTPAAWFAEGEQLFLAPTPSDAFTLRIRAIVGENDLSADSDLPMIPARYHTSILTAGMVLFYETLQDTAKYTAAQQSLDRQIGQMLRSSSEYTGSPRVHVTTGW